MGADTGWDQQREKPRLDTLGRDDDAFFNFGLLVRRLTRALHRTAAPLVRLEPRMEFIVASCAPPDFTAAVGELCRWAFGLLFIPYHTKKRNRKQIFV